MDINSDITTIPLQTQKAFDSAAGPDQVAETLAKGVPLRGEVGRPDSSAVLNISPEAQTLALKLEAVEDEEAQYGQRSIIGGVGEQGILPSSKAADLLNASTVGAPVAVVPTAERDLGDVVGDQVEQSVQMASIREGKEASNADVLDLRMAMQAAAFQIPPEVNGTLPPQPTGKLAAQDDPSLTPVDPALQTSLGPMASSVMGMDPLRNLPEDYLNNPSASQGLGGNDLDMMTYAADGDGGKSASQVEAQVVDQVV
jgi:hypothetical protein